MTGTRLWRAAALAVAMGGAGCATGPSPDEEVRRMAEIQEQGEGLSHAADALEDRLLADQANLLLWQELARRHQRVSAVATRTQLEHFSSMVQLMEQQEEKARRLKRRHLASLEGDQEPEDGAEGGGSAPGAARARN